METLKTLLTVFLISLITTNSFADDTSVYLDKGQTAPFAGFLINQNRTQTLINEEKQLKDYKLINDSLQKSLDLSQQNFDLSEKKANILLDQNTKMAEELKSDKSTSNLERIVWFSLGVLATGFAIYGAKKAIGN